MQKSFLITALVYVLVSVALAHAASLDEQPNEPSTRADGNLPPPSEICPRKNYWSVDKENPFHLTTTDTSFARYEICVTEGDPATIQFYDESFLNDLPPEQLSVLNNSPEAEPEANRLLELLRNLPSLKVIRTNQCRTIDAMQLSVMTFKSLQGKSGQWAKGTWCRMRFTQSNPTCERLPPFLREISLGELTKLGGDCTYASMRASQCGRRSVKANCEFVRDAVTCNTYSLKDFNREMKYISMRAIGFNC